MRTDIGMIIVMVGSVLLALLLSGLLAYSIIAKQHAKESFATDKDYLTVAPEATFEDLLDAIEWVESKGDKDAIGDGGDAVGCMQIWPILVDDVNRILGCNKYTYKDRYFRVKSREMAAVYFNYYCPDFLHREIGLSANEYKARIWNGGPNGHNKECTKPYWEKVKARLETK